MRNRVVSIGALVLYLSASTSVFAVTGGGDLTFKPAGMGQVVFSHEEHVNVKGLKCNGCHYAMFMREQGTYKMDMAKITKDNFCYKCHNGQKSFDLKNPKNCVKCHR